MYAHDNCSRHSITRKATNRKDKNNNGNLYFGWNTNQMWKNQGNRPITLEAGGHTEQINAVVSGIMETDVFLGYDWLEKHNPEIDWKKGTINFTRCPKDCHLAGQMTMFNNQ